MAFEKIVGQDSAIMGLKNIILNDHVKGSYLFLGIDGVGKRSTAIEFAKALNCERASKPTKSGEGCRCLQCKKIDKMNHPDVYLIYPEGPSNSIKINIARDIIYQANLKPYEGRKRIFIINDADRMTEEAQNSFLKILEEPPLNHILVLTTSNITGLRITIISRCKTMRFYPLSKINIYDILCNNGIDEKTSKVFSHIAMGSIGRAFSFKEKDLITKRDSIMNDFFLRKSALLKETVLNEYISKDVEETLYLILSWYRDILVSAWTRDGNNLLNIDRSEEIISYAHRFTKEKLEKDILTIMNTMGYVKANVNPKIALFNMIVALKEN